MQQLLNASDVAARYKCSLPTARLRMRQMKHMENPLMVTEDAVADWERSKMIPGVENISKQKQTCNHKSVNTSAISFISKRMD